MPFGAGDRGVTRGGGQVAGYHVADEAAVVVAAGRVERVRGVGICGSDLSLISGARRAPAYPWIPGHAATGEIVAAGPGVDGGRTGQRVVIGAGSQGALLCVALIARGITPHVLEPDEGRRRLGVSLGATATGPGDTGFGTVYETSGAEAALAEAIGRSAPGATVTLIGLGNPAPRTDAGLVVRRQLTLRGSLGLTNLSPGAVPRARYPLDEAAEAFRAAQNVPGKTWIKLA